MKRERAFCQISFWYDILRMRRAFSPKYIYVVEANNFGLQYCSPVFVPIGAVLPIGGGNGLRIN